MARAVAYILCATVMVAVAIACTAASGVAASSSTVVTMSVPSATQLASSCANAGGGGLSFGTVLPDTPAISPACTITFGSSNDTAALRVAQSDGGGTAMWRFGTGALDATWASSGVSAPAVAGDQAIFGATLQRDGRLLATGMQGADVVVMRLDTAGALDTTFDGDSGTGNGTVLLSPPGGGLGLDVLQDSQGRIVIGVRTNDQSAFHAYRLLPDGRRDTSFDGDGFASIDISGGQDFLDAATVTADDKVLLAGCSAVGWGGCNPDGVAVALARLDVNGRADTSFDADGVVTQNLDAGYDYAVDVETDSSGRVYVTGMLAAQAFVARFLASGALDTAGFNAPNGFRRWDATPGSESVSSVAIQPDGALLVTGADGTNAFADRLTPAGAMDPAWASADIPITGGGQPEGNLLLGDGSLMATGPVAPWPGNNQWVAKWTAAGAADTTFTGDGMDIQSRAAGAGEDNGAKLVAFRDGRIALVGFATPGATGRDLTVSLYDDGGSVSDYADTVADWNTAAATSMFGVCLQSTTATAAWPTTGSCSAVDGTNWRAVPASVSDAVAKAAFTGVSGTQNQTATFRFGIRPAASQPRGTYWAETVFEVVAPNI